MQNISVKKLITFWIIQKPFLNSQSASARLVDHSTVRNLEEAKMYTQRNHIVQSFYDSEVVYHKYLKSLHKQYSHYMALAQTKEKVGVHY